jgi:hypothetical protein
MQNKHFGLNSRSNKNPLPEFSFSSIIFGSQGIFASAVRSRRSSTLHTLQSGGKSLLYSVYQKIWKILLYCTNLLVGMQDKPFGLNPRSNNNPSPKFSFSRTYYLWVTGYVVRRLCEVAVVLHYIHYRVVARACYIV